MTVYRGRFAPSPTGPLHLGSLVAAVGSWVRARSQNGAWLIRIEDIDPPREVPGAAADILETLAAFGMRSDETVVYQSTRANAYQRQFDALKSEQRVFPCWCSRSDLEPFGGLHRDRCIAPPDSTRTPAWRMRVRDESVLFVDRALGRQHQNLREEVGDFVVLRNDGWFAYQLAVVIDDAAQGITEVVRGADLLDSTARQIFLQQSLGLPTPAYLHLPLVIGDDGRKLSKQDRAHPVDRTDPVPTLQHSLRFLGFDISGVAPNIDALFATAIRQADTKLLRSGDNVS